MKRRSLLWKKVLLLFLLLSSVLTACSQAQLSSTELDNTLIIGSGNPTLFNPYYHMDSTSSQMTELLFSGLVRVNEELEIEPDLAIDTGQISNDGLQLTYTLKQGIKWHDGQELTAEDVVFSFSIPMHPDYTGPRASAFTKLKEIRAEDRYTVTFILKEPDASFSLTAGYAILPKHILGKVPVEALRKHAFNYEQPIGSGPFRFVEWKDGEYVKLEAFEQYHQGKPALDGIIFKIIEDPNAQLLQLQAGDIDLTTVPAGEVETVNSFAHTKLSSTLALRYDYIGWNLRQPLFQDKRVRQALTHAIDRELMIETLMEGQAAIAHLPLSPLSWAYDEDVPQFEYNPKKARQLLAAAGWKPGPDGILEKNGQRFSFQLLFNHENSVRQEMSLILQQMWAEVGIEVRPVQMEFSAMLKKVEPPHFQFDAVLLAWGLSTDPDPTSIWHSKEIEQGLNHISYSNPELDQLMDKNLMLTNQKERRKVLKQIYFQIAEDQPYSFLFYPYQHIAMPVDLEGYIHHPGASFYNVHEWRLKRSKE